MRIFDLEILANLEILQMFSTCIVFQEKSVFCLGLSYI